MKEILILSASSYDDSDKINYGDCILINTGTELIIYDCGHEKHAETVLSYMDKNNFNTAKVVLSHNDEDHFRGIPTLLESGRISLVITTLLLKYTDDILKRIDDKRKSRESVKMQLLELYDNIAKLSGEPIEDVYKCSEIICNGVTIVGPDKDYMLDTVAKRLDGREGNMQDGETAVNATSIQLKVSFAEHSVLLCGDCSFAAIKNKVLKYDCIQLPHHGKPKQAVEIWKEKYNQPLDIYIISDNTGNSNGGSDDLKTTGHRVYNTKNAESIRIDASFLSKSRIQTHRTLGL